MSSWYLCRSVGTLCREVEYVQGMSRVERVSRDEDEDEDSGWCV